jgi:hypothetical protein
MIYLNADPSMHCSNFCGAVQEKIDFKPKARAVTRASHSPHELGEEQPPASRPNLRRTP